ncbi:MAG: hypothetical protein MJ231_06310, partial [bacterium]|nr:hypothetical protein [bacterium]
MPTVTKIGLDVQKIAGLKTDAAWSALQGRYKEYKNAVKSLASEGVKDFETFKNVQGIQVKGAIPLFSKTGMHLLKIKILEAFRIKTPDEKELARLANEDVLKEKFVSNVRNFFEKDIRFKTDEVIKNKVEPAIQEKTDSVMRMLSPSLMSAYFESLIENDGKNMQELVNQAIKEIPRGIPMQ